MRFSLEEEREAVLEFLYTVIDCVSVLADADISTALSSAPIPHAEVVDGLQNMVPVQEAVLDATCHPWCKVYPACQCFDGQIKLVDKSVLCFDSMHRCRIAH